MTFPSEGIAAPTLLGSDLGFTEGPVITPDGTVYITSSTHGRVYRVDETGLDVDGDLLIGALSTEEGRPGEIQVWSPTGEQLDTYTPGTGVAYTNVALGPDGRLIIAGSTDGTVLSVGWPVGGLPLHPFR